MDVENLEKGDRVLFNDRKTPLTVVSIDEELTVEGPHGALYTVYEENNSLLVCSEGKKRYSSYCKNLRKVGKWIETENGWKHSKTGASVELYETENGFWKVKINGVEDEFDNPMYGFTRREFALEEAEKFVKDNPEGK